MSSDTLSFPSLLGLLLMCLLQMGGLGSNVVVEDRQP